jgi:hypothetical protein
VISLFLYQGKAEKGEEQADAEVQRARLGVVEDPPADLEGQRRGVPELPQRPGDRDGEDQLAGDAAGRPPPGIGVGDELLQLRRRFFYFTQPFSL